MDSPKHPFGEPFSPHDAFSAPLARPKSSEKKTKISHFHNSLQVPKIPKFRADFWEGDVTKHFSVKKKGFSVKRGEAIQ